MKSLILFSILVFVTGAIGEVPGAFKVEFDVLRGNNKRDLSSENEGRFFVKRDDNAEMELQNKNTFYIANLKIGSNNEEVQVLVDTGSSDLWVMSHDLVCEIPSYSYFSKRDRILDPGPDNDKQNQEVAHKIQDFVDDDSEFNTEAQPTPTPVNKYTYTWTYTRSYTYKTTTDTCTSYGSFKTSNSDSFLKNDTAESFEILYADGTDAYGVWGTDDVNFGDVTVDDLSFAVVNQTSSNVGVLGIGLSGLETTYSYYYDDLYEYENLPMKLKSQGIINKVAYSVYLGEKTSKTGSILFGAVDSAKYSGELQTVKLYNSYSSYYSDPVKFEVNVNGLQFNYGEDEMEITPNGYTAVLDTGSTFSYVPRPLLTKIGESLDGVYSSALGAYIVECVDNENYYFTISFSGIDIKIPYSNMIVEYATNRCFLGVFATYLDYILFGDNVLRNMYLVYDLEDYEISLAQAKYTTEENITPISSSIPNAKKAPNYSSTEVQSEDFETSVLKTATFGSNIYTPTYSSSTTRRSSSSIRRSSSRTSTSSRRTTSSSTTSGTGTDSSNSNSNSEDSPSLASEIGLSSKLYVILGMSTLFILFIQI